MSFVVLGPTVVSSEIRQNRSRQSLPSLEKVLLRNGVPLGAAMAVPLIVAAAVKSGATRLLSEDLNPGQKIAGLRIENPFAAVP